MISGTVSAKAVQQDVLNVTRNRQEALRVGESRDKI